MPQRETQKYVFLQRDRKSHFFHGNFAISGNGKKNTQSMKLKYGCIAPNNITMEPIVIIDCKQAKQTLSVNSLVQT